MTIPSGSLDSQQASFTVSVFPTITSGSTTVRIYNSYLASGGIRSARVCSVSGDVLEDFTRDIQQGKHGIQDVQLTLSRYTTGMYFLNFQTGNETFTFKVIKA